MSNGGRGAHFGSEKGRQDEILFREKWSGMARRDKIPFSASKMSPAAAFDTPYLDLWGRPAKGDGKSSLFSF